MIDCKRCGLTHPEFERCWDAMRHELAIKDEHLDLMVDEFKRIKSLCSSCDMPRSLALEISGLCDRAITNTRQRVPLIVQRDDWERKFWELDQQWSVRFRDEKTLAAKLLAENAALRDVIEALHAAVDGKRFDDASIADMLNGAMKIPSANTESEALT